MYSVTTSAAALSRRPEDLALIRGSEIAYVEAVEKRDAVALIFTNRSFHMAIAQAGRNTYFIQLFSRLLDEGRRILRLYYASFADQLPRQYSDEHRAMVRAIERGDAGEADRLANAHVRQFVHQIQAYLGRDALSNIMLKG